MYASSGGSIGIHEKYVHCEGIAISIYMRHFNANLKAGRKIFTTNSKTNAKFLELRPNQGEIGDDHVNAMLARCVLVEVKEKMYTHQQEDERDGMCNLATFCFWHLGIYLPRYWESIYLTIGREGRVNRV